MGLNKRLEWEIFKTASKGQKLGNWRGGYRGYFACPKIHEKQGDPIRKLTAKHFANEFWGLCHAVEVGQISEIELIEYFSYRELSCLFKDYTSKIKLEENLENYEEKDELTRIFYIFDNELRHELLLDDYFKSAREVFGENFLEEHEHSEVLEALGKEEKYNEIVQNIYTFVSWIENIGDLLMIYSDNYDPSLESVSLIDDLIEGYNRESNPETYRALDWAEEALFALSAVNHYRNRHNQGDEKE